jgi:hypothetical protein
VQVESFLEGKSFSIDRNINAQAMDAHGEKVKKRLLEAAKKKKKMTLRLRPIARNVTLAQITRAYMDDGGAKKKGKKGKKKSSAERETGVWAGMEQFEQQAAAEEHVVPQSAATSTSGAAAVVKGIALDGLTDQEYVRATLPEYKGDPDIMIAAIKDLAARGVLKTQNT